MVNPTEEMQKNYDLLLKAEEEIINKLQHGSTRILQTVYFSDGNQD